MDIAKVGENSIRVKSRNSTFIINPEKKIEEDIIILTQKPQDYSTYGGKMVIAGPGEYEVAGVSIKGEAAEGGIAYDFLEEGQKMVLLSSPKVAKTKDTEDANVVVVYLDQDSDTLSEIAAQVLVAVGPDSLLPQDKASIKKVDKLNLKKTEDYKGFTVHLSK